jgi:hypothetical protein
VTEFEQIFFPETSTSDYSKDVAVALVANALSSIAIHELGHSFGLVQGPSIEAYSRVAPPGTFRYRDQHNAPDLPGRFMNREATFREDAMIRDGAVFPFAATDYGMEPIDRSLEFPPVCLKYLRRLLPRTGTVQ